MWEKPAPLKDKIAIPPKFSLACGHLVFSFIRVFPSTLALGLKANEKPAWIEGVLLELIVVWAWKFEDPEQQMRNAYQFETSMGGWMERFFTEFVHEVVSIKLLDLKKEKSIYFFIVYVLINFYIHYKFFIVYFSFNVCIL